MQRVLIARFVHDFGTHADDCAEKMTAVRRDGDHLANNALRSASADTTQCERNYRRLRDTTEKAEPAVDSLPAELRILGI